ncbi:helix-turn-helix transcriptional regulator [Cohnella algarum]|uniref:helix-turn-helix transcriptional regulator n=1 Tax=Cohnella algarum TaxID=2044859 RepID=UPI0019683A06|nr:WYL domain-containing protein [Cohnella algarum]MBN2981252.1 WYL domain-containing protein [Cohnella algarum]
MRGDRLLRILHLLQAQGKATTGELARRLEVSPRTVHRDMESLSASGFPIYAERGASGGWVLQEGYRTRLTGLTTGEITALLALQSSSAVRDLKLPDDTSSALRKLFSALPPARRDEAEFVRRHLHIDGAGWHEAGEPAPFLETVQKAVWEQRKMLIRYVGADERIHAPFAVCPWGLVAKRQTWYFAGQVEEERGEDRKAGKVPDRNAVSDGNADRKGGPDPEASPKAKSGPKREPKPEPDVKPDAMACASPEDRVRTFRVSRLVSAELLEDRFQVPETFDLASWWQRSTARFKASLPSYPAQVRVRTDAWRQFASERYVRILSSRQASEAWVEADVDLQTESYAARLLLGLGASALALRPESLRQSMANEAAALLKLYAEGGEAFPEADSRSTD